MSYFLCPNDGNRYDIFGSGGGVREAARLGVQLLSQIPLEMSLRESGDKGTPILQNDPNSKISQLFYKAAQVIRKQCII
jgi:ATP-binding protein involved in chromosome partitioning